MTFQQLQAFVAVCETNNFAKAAKLLNMYPSNLSYIISEFENSLDVLLLNRSKKGVYPNILGQNVYIHAKEILALLSSCIENTDSIHQNRNCLSIAYSRQFNLAPFQSRLKELYFNFSKLGLSLDLIIPNDQKMAYHALNTRRADMAILYDDIFESDSYQINSYIYALQTPVYNAMMSLKYIVDNDNSLMNDRLYTKMAENDKFVAYKNNYYLPIAYCVSEEVEKWAATGSNPFTIQNDYWTRATDAGDVFEKIPATSSHTENIREDDDLLSENFTYHKDGTDESGSIILKYEIPKSQNVYLYADCTTAEQIDVYGTNGLSKSQDPDDPYILDCGYYEAGEIMTVEITIPANKDSGYADRPAMAAARIRRSPAMS